VIKELQKLRDNKSKPKQQVRANQIVRVAINTEPKNPQNPWKTYSQVVSHSFTETEQSTSTESMLVQIMQMLKDQDLRLKKMESYLKITNNH
jgi:hypothetical protein